MLAAAQSPAESTVGPVSSHLKSWSLNPKKKNLNEKQRSNSIFLEHVYYNQCHRTPCFLKWNHGKQQFNIGHFLAQLSLKKIVFA